MILAPLAAARPEGIYLLGGVLGVYTCFALSVIIHELAHFYAGRWLGLKPWRLTIGHGPILLEKEYRSFTLVLKVFPYSGAVYPFPTSFNPNLIRWRMLLMVAAGPMSNALLFGIFTFIALQSPKFMTFTAIPMQMLIANGWALLFTLFPHVGTYDGRRLPSDGLNMIYLLRGRSPPVEQYKYSGNRDEMRQSRPSWKWIVSQVRPELYLLEWRQQLADSKLSPDERCGALDGFATCVLMYGANEFLEEADRYSEELLRLKPDEWTVKGTRGGVLIEIGRIEEGTAMLKDVMQHDPSVFDRAISASFLALGELRQNNREAAVQWLRTSRELDPQCGSLHRIEKLMSTG
jgi:hypothetical protein